MSTFANTPARRSACAPVKKTLDREHAKLAPAFTDSNDEQKYYKKTAHILFHYYDSVENGGGVQQTPASLAPATPVPVGSNKITANVKQKSIVDFLQESADSDSKEESAPNLDSKRNSIDLSSPPVSMSKYSKMSRNELLESFLKNVDDDYVPEQDPSEKCDPRYMRRSLAETECSHCGSDSRVLVPNEGYLHCMECDTIEYVTLDSERPSYRDPPREIHYFCYRRSNHLQEWINQTQGREYTNIPENVYDAIMVELKKQKFNNLAKLNRQKLKEIMKKLGLNKYYEHIPHILHHISGAPLARIPPNVEAQMRRMFAQIQVPFMKHAPPNRLNFCSYAFICRKFLELLGHDDLIHHFPTLKARSKIYEQDKVWKDICKELRWEFIPTI